LIPVEPLEICVPLRYAHSGGPSFSRPRVYQFRVVVQGVSPLIWRRLLIRSDMSLATLQTMLQIVFAWSDMHLHYFRIHGKEYGSILQGGPCFDVDPRQVPWSPGATLPKFRASLG
jgi:hypothetical protein